MCIFTPVFFLFINRFILFLQSLKLTQFRNYKQEKIDFHPAFNTITGLNGMGKTNILDAIFFLSMGKGYFTGLDRYSVQHSQEFFRIQGFFTDGENSLDVVVKYKTGGKKEVEVNGVLMERLSDHVGKIPCVIFAPEDITLLQETSEARRNFLNHTLIQYDAEYLDAIITYNKLLKSRNSFLKQSAAGHSYNDLYLESLHEQMAGPARLIFNKRKQAIQELNILFELLYKVISGNSEECFLTYKSQLENEDPLHMWKESLSMDKLMGRTTAGIHKDDILLWMNGKPIKNFGSQGQIKSYILALKLAQYRLLESTKKSKPIIMLDDIFDKLDEKRVNYLLELMAEDSFGQVFITDTDTKRVPSILRDKKLEGKQFLIANGGVESEFEYQHD